MRYLLIMLLFLASCVENRNFHHVVEVEYIQGGKDTITVDYIGKYDDIWISTSHEAIPVLRIGGGFDCKSIAYNVYKFKILQ